MTFTFSDYAGITPQASPLQNAIGKLLGSYTKTKEASYLPRRLEADIFSKEISPLAALASSPNFTGFNPEIQKGIAQRIGQYLSGNASSPNNQEADGETAGYASDKDIYGRLSHGAHETFGRGKRSQVGRAKLLNLGEQFGLPETISKALGGTQASQELASYEQAIEEGVQRLKLKGYSDASARQVLNRIPGENDNTYSKRIKSLFINTQKEEPRETTNTKSDETMGEQEREQESADLETTGKIYNASPEEVKEAITLGIKNEKDFKDFLKWKKEQ